MVHLKDWVGDGYQLFQARADFPNEWHRFLNPTDRTSTNLLDIPMSLNRFPLAVQGRGVWLADVSVLIGWKAIRKATVPTQEMEFRVGQGVLTSSAPDATTQEAMALVDGV